MIDCDVQRAIETNQDTTDPESHGISANVMGRLLCNHVAKKDKLEDILTSKVVISHKTEV